MNEKKQPKWKARKKIVWNVAIMAAIKVCEEEIKILKRHAKAEPSLLENAGIVEGIKNLIKKLIIHEGCSNVPSDFLNKESRTK